MDSPFTKYKWSELVGQRQDGQILSSSDFFTLRFIRVVRLSSSRREQSNILRKVSNFSQEERETALDKNNKEQIILKKGDIPWQKQDGKNPWEAPSYTQKGREPLTSHIIHGEGDIP